MALTGPLLLYLFIQSITPGPNNLTCLYLGARGGLAGARRFITASMLSLFVKAVLCGALNLFLAKHLPSVMNVLKWVGAAFMLYLAWKMAVSGWKEEEGSDNTSFGAGFRDGVMLQLLNIKSWIVSVSMFAVYVIPIRSDFPTVLLVSAVFVVFAAACSVIWALFGSALRGFISKYRKPFGIVMGLSLVYCAVSAVLP